MKWQKFDLFKWIYEVPVKCGKELFPFPKFQTLFQNFEFPKTAEWSNRLHVKMKDMETFNFHSHYVSQFFMRSRENKNKIQNLWTVDFLEKSPVWLSTTSFVVGDSIFIFQIVASLSHSWMWGSFVLSLVNNSSLFFFSGIFHIWF